MMQRLSKHGAMAGILLGLIGGLVLPVSPGHAGPPAAYTKEHQITIDPTLLIPTSWWYVPGVTPTIYNSDPESMDAYKTSEKKTIVLKPGKYKFVSFTFDFPFAINLDGKLEFSKAFDQCVDGRGTQTLLIRCKKTYPHGGTREYNYE